MSDMARLQVSYSRHYLTKKVDSFGNGEGPVVFLSPVVTQISVFGILKNKSDRSWAVKIPEGLQDVFMAQPTKQSTESRQLISRLYVTHGRSSLSDLLCLDLHFTLYILRCAAFLGMVLRD